MSTPLNLDLNFSQPPDLPTLEESILEWWQQTKAFQKSVEQRPTSNKYVFYDGPPFATGMPHYGHLLASTIKDVIPRFWTMQGYRVERVWGWDCHGLPIENMIEKKLNLRDGKKGIEEYGIGNFNEACRTEVLRLDQEWERIINRLGRWVDFKNNYKTMDATFMESVWWGFKQLADKGLIYQDKKVILYCPHCVTPLSKFEIAMDNSYTEVEEFATTYKYKVIGQANTYLLAWSTTPWNKIATPALAVNPKLRYVKVAHQDQLYWLAENRLEHLTDSAYEIVDQMSGQELTQLEFELHYDFYPDRTDQELVGKVIADEFVSADEGTGVVTLAVYGEEDLRVMKQHSVQLVEHVDEEGKLKPEVTPWAGEYILDVNDKIDADLSKRGLVYDRQPHHHSVPTCYRCETRLYYAPIPAWFIDVQAIKQRLLELNHNINWFPNHLKNGQFRHGLNTAPDWNISRSRYWGTPMPIWQSSDGQHTRIIGSIEELKTWAVDPKQTANLSDIHRQFIDHIEVWVDDKKSIRGTRIPEVFDCWVESGSMPFASKHYPFADKKEFEQNYPAQFVSEYIAQTKAWFYCMHVISTGLFDTIAFENAVTTGNILAEDGAKMSKSKRNYPDPMELIDRVGVDSLRLYLMQSVVMRADNINFSEDEVVLLRRKVLVMWWNLLGFFHQFADQSVDVTSHPSLSDHVMDRWLVSVTQSAVSTITEAYQNYDVVTASRTLTSMIDQVSTWYLRLSRERIKSASNTQASHAFGWTLYSLGQLAAPVTPFFAELVHHCLVATDTSIHHTDWPGHQPELVDSTLESEMELVRQLIELGHAQRHQHQLKVRQPLASATLNGVALQYSDQLTELIIKELNVKRVIWGKPQSNLSVELDTQLTPELKLEGEAREIIRTLQRLRKKAGLRVGQPATATLPSWPAEWEEEIKARTDITSLQTGPNPEVTP